MKIRLFVFFLVFHFRAMGASLPGELSAVDVDRVIEILGFGGATRLLRSAEPYEAFPGLKIGVELGFIPSKDINALGNQLGSIPTIMFPPRLYVAKGLFLDLEFIFSFFPSGIISTISSYGGILKWTFLHEAEHSISAAGYGGYTKISAFDSTYEGSDWEFGVVASKDYVRTRPFAGLGLLFASGSVPPSFAKTPKFSGSQSTIHIFLGLEVELPVNVTLQFDLMNLSPSGSLFLGKKF